MYYAWRVGRHVLLSFFVLAGIAEMTERVAAGWYAIGFTVATICCGCMMLVVNAAMLSWQEFLELPQVGLKIPLPKQCKREMIEDELDGELDGCGRAGSCIGDASGSSARKTLMQLYGQKASAMEEQGKLNKNARRLAEEEKNMRHARGEYSDEENEVEDDIENGKSDSKKVSSSYVFGKIDLDRVDILMKQLLDETKPRCQGCEGLSTCHDENCMLEEHQFDESGKKILKKKKKKKKLPKYRFQREEESAEERSQRVRKHVKLSDAVPSLSFEARRIQRLQGKAPAPETNPVVKHGVSLSQQASTLQSIGGAARLF
jgi:hypothetical protein